MRSVLRWLQANVVLLGGPLILVIGAAPAEAVSPILGDILTVEGTILGGAMARAIDPTSGEPEELSSGGWVLPKSVAVAGDGKIFENVQEARRFRFRALSHFR